MRKLRLTVLVLAIAVCGSYLYAQDSDTVESAEDTVEASGAMQVKLTPTEMVTAAEKLLEKMREYLKDVVGVQQVARKQKDVIKLNCVNDKLLQIKQLLNIAEASRTNLDESIAQSDEAGRYHEYGKIVVTEEQVRNLAEEARNCIGEELIYLGPSDVDVDGPDIPDDPAADGPDSIDLEPPAYASPFA